MSHEKTAKKVSRSSPKNAKAKPRLLSGGNPQVEKGDGDAPVQAYIAAMPGWKKEVGVRLDRLIGKTVKNLRKAVRWNSPFYGIEGQGWFLTFHCFNKYIKVAFLRGSTLKPLPPIESKVPHTRYLHIHEDEEMDEALLKAWIQQAFSQPGDPLF